jgi:hypothetical protein
MVWSADSCTVTVGSQTTGEVCPGCGASTDTQRFTIPLALIESANVKRSPTVWMKSDKFLSGTELQYALNFLAESTSFHEVQTTDSYPNNRPVESEVRSAYITFGDERAAEQVEAAFLHAADLCGRKGFK